MDRCTRLYRTSARSRLSSNAGSSPGAVPDRGWLVRRALLVADVVGLLLAFLTVRLVFGSSSDVTDRYNALAEFWRN
jgi:hypothetical protein